MSFISAPQAAHRQINFLISRPTFTCSKLDAVESLAIVFVLGRPTSAKFKLSFRNPLHLSFFKSSTTLYLVQLVTLHIFKSKSTSLCSLLHTSIASHSSYKQLTIQDERSDQYQWYVDLPRRVPHRPQNVLPNILKITKKTDEIVIFSRSSWLPDCQLLLGGESCVTTASAKVAVVLLGRRNL